MMKTSMLAALALAGALHGAALAQQTIKLGVITIDAGPLAVSAGAINDGAMLAVETLNARGGALGRKYELVIQGHDGPPAGAIAAATKLVRQQGVSFFTGISPSGNSLAVSAKLADLDALYLDATAASDDLTGKNCAANYFRVGISDSSQVQVWRELAQRNGAKSFDLLMADIAAARDATKRFVGVLPSFGGSIGKEIFAPLNTTDFGGQIAQLQAKPADSLVMYMPGSAGIALAKQQAPFGLFDKYKLVMSASMVNEILIAGQGDTTAGVWSSQSYFWQLPGEANAEFVKAFESRFNRKPSYLAADAYLAFVLVHEAIVKAKSADVAAVRTALNGLTLDTIVGPVEMRAADHQLVRPMVVVQAVKAAPGKGEIVLRSVEPAARITLPPSAECKMG
ncbi:MAG TPA: ABC transporter substrate-binding protein [Rubrivivax sp.]|nr:ABC transporter substrate-binding protein [Rubrivivax sp.]